MPTIGDLTAPGWSAAWPAPFGTGASGAGRQDRCRDDHGRRRRAPVQAARDADAVFADRVLDLAEPGFRQQRGEFADQFGVGRERRRGPAGAALLANSTWSLAGFGFEQCGERLDRQLVALRPEPADDAGGGKAHIRMMPEALAPEDIRQMHLDDRQVGGIERVEDRDRRMGESAGVEDDAVGGLARLVDPIDQLALVVGLAEIDRQVERRGAGLAALPRHPRACRSRKSPARAPRASSGSGR